jgi:lipopolysaccharide export system permease protein
MILFRYLCRQIFQTSAAVTLVLLCIVTSGRLAKYLSQSSTGDLSSEIVFWVIFYRIPDFLPLVIPLGFFIGVLLALGRLYTDSEMVVINACGVSKKRLVGITLFPAVVVSVLVAYLTIIAAPSSLNRLQVLLEESNNNDAFSFVRPGKFQHADNSQSVSYAEAYDQQSKTISDVLLVDYNDEGSVLIIRAESARLTDSDVLLPRYLNLVNGSIYDGFIGQADYRIANFSQFSQSLTIVRPEEQVQLEVDAKSTFALFNSDSNADIAALHWRFSLPVVVLVVAVMALALSKTDNRSGRYLKLLPAILMYLIYIISITTVRTQVEYGSQPAIAIWVLHTLFLSLAFSILLKDDIQRAFAMSRLRAKANAL